MKYSAVATTLFTLIASAVASPIFDNQVNSIKIVDYSIETQDIGPLQVTGGGSSGKLENKQLQHTVIYFLLE